MILILLQTLQTYILVLLEASELQLISSKQSAILWCTNECNAGYKLGKIILHGYRPKNINIPSCRAFCEYKAFLVYLETRLNQAQILILASIVSHTYSLFIFDVDNSSFVNEALHCVLISFTSCNVQGSLLSEKEEQF